MKKLLIPSLLLCTFIAAVVVSCKKYNNAGSGPSQSLNQLFSDLRSTPQNFTVQAGRDTAIYAAKGTMLHFYPFSFKDAANNIITSGIINISLVEMYKPGDMVQNRRPTTTADGYLLKSGGQVNISASTNGKEVFANVYAIGFMQQNTSTRIMQLYMANLDSNVSWIIGDTSRPGRASECTQLNGMPYFLFDSCTNFKDVNCDSMADRNGGSNTVIKIMLPDNSFSPENTDVFVIFPNWNCVTKGYVSYDPTTNTLVPGNHLDIVKVGENYEVVLISNKNGKYYYYEQSGVTTMNMTINAVMAPETRGDIIDRLQGL